MPSKPSWTCSTGYCAECNFRTQTNPLTSDELLEYYETETFSAIYERGSGVINKTTQMRFLRILNLIEQVYGSFPREILDVGTHKGHFLKYLEQHNIGSKLIGNDFKNFGDLPDFIEGEFIGLQFDQKFSMITSFHVLEHITELDLFVSKVYDTLTDDGVWLFEVPDASRRPLNNLSYFYVEHIHYFSDLSLERLLHKHGFEIALFSKVSEDYKDDHHGDMPVITIAAKKKTGNSHRIQDVKDIDNILKNMAQMVKGYKHIILWGSGMYASAVLGELQTSKITVCDGNDLKVGQFIGGHQILSPAEALTGIETDSAIVIPCSFIAEDKIVSLINEMDPKLQILKLTNMERINAI